MQKIQKAFYYPFYRCFVVYHDSKRLIEAIFAVIYTKLRKTVLLLSRFFDIMYKMKRHALCAARKALFSCFLHLMVQNQIFSGG